MKVTFDTKWLDAISEQDDCIRLVLIEAIFAFLEGKEPLLSNEAKKIFNMLKPFLMEEADKRMRLAERSRQNGMKGGRKKESEKTKEQPKKNLTEPKEPTGFLKWLEKPEFQNRSASLLALDKWKERNIPYLYKNMRPLTEKEFQCLMEKKYTSKQICDVYLKIENRKDLRKRYSNPYRTLLNWLNNDYGKS